jgi:hypothetical protein
MHFVIVAVGGIFTDEGSADILLTYHYSENEVSHYATFFTLLLLALSQVHDIQINREIL